MDISVQLVEDTPINLNFGEDQPINISLGEVIEIGGGNDKNYTTTFTNQAQLEIAHNLNKYPSVTIMDSANDQVVGDVDYLDLNNVRITFSSSFSGRLTFN